MVNLPIGPTAVKRFVIWRRILMSDKALVLVRTVLVCFAVIFSGPYQPVLAETPSLADSMPSGAIAFAELSGLEKVIDGIQQSQVLELALASEPYQAVMQTSEYRKAQAGRQILESVLETDLWTLGKTLLGGQVAAALYPQPGQDEPNVVLIIRATDPKALAHIRERIEPLLVLGEDFVKRTTLENGVDILNVNDDAFVAVHDEWVAAANNQDLLAQTLVLLSGEGKKRLSEDGPFVAMAQQMGADHTGQVYINTKAIAAGTGGRLGNGQSARFSFVRWNYRDDCSQSLRRLHVRYRGRSFCIERWSEGRPRFAGRYVCAILLGFS